jgi:hypothetical protein
MPRLESAGYHIVLHIHDEISAEVPLDFGTAEEFLQILTTPPSWADGLPIAAKVREGERFCKINKPEASPDDDAAPEDPVDDNEMAEKVPTDIEEDAGDDPGEAKEDPSGGPDDAEEVHGGGDGYASGERLWGHNVTEYIYRDENGAPYLRVTRKSAKQFPQARWENGRWVWGKPTGLSLAGTPRRGANDCSVHLRRREGRRQRRLARACRDHKLRGRWQVDHRS